MDNTKIKQENLLKRRDDVNQRGSAIVIAVFVLVLVSVFVALALSRTASEAAAVGNEASEGRTFYAAQGSLEMMTKNFNKVFETKLNPADADFKPVREGVEPGLSKYDFTREVLKTSTSEYAVINEGAYAGLYATRDNWRLRSTATDANGIQVQLTRNILNNRIPIFQFGIFYNDNLEVHPGPDFAFGGRVHSNGSLFLSAGGGRTLFFDSRVHRREIVTDLRRNGSDPGTGQIKIKNGTTNVQLTSTMGSVLKTPASGIPVFQDKINKPNLYDEDMPVEYANAAWATNEGQFGGNLLARQKSLDLPLKLANSNNRDAPVDYIELIKRGRNVGTNGTDLFNDKNTGTVVPVTADNKDSDVTVTQRYYNKTGIRISLADRKAKLPGCASGTGTDAVAAECGKRLDGDANGDSEGDFSGAARGYQPKQMQPASDNYIATRVNGNRLGTSGTAAGRQVWIKVELISRDAADAIIAKDVTADILSLGVTEPAPSINGKFEIKTPSKLR